MTELFNLVFQSFWTWAGTVVLLSIAVGGLAAFKPWVKG